ncbi:MAG: hypothetical protein QNI92_10065 [Desulfobacterales bacterium]|nr:hypothetical protein [Desulfobacterales bacterium]
MRLNKFFVILTVFCVISANICKAEPGKAIIELLEKPGMSLFERGLISLEKSVNNVVRLEPMQHQRIKGPVFEWMNPSVFYDEAADKLQLHFRLKTKDRNNRKDLCRNATNYIKEMLTAGWDPEDPSDVTFVGSAFLPYKITSKDQYSKADIRRSRYMDSIAYINVVVQAENNPHDFTQCSSRITADDMSIREFPPKK